MGEYDATQEDWDPYAQRLDYYFTANSVVEANKKKAVLLTVVGPSTFKLLKSLVAMANVDDKSYKDVMTEHCCPKPSEV